MVATIIAFLVVFTLTIVVLVAVGIGMDSRVRWWSRRSGADEDRSDDHRDAPGVGPSGEDPNP